MFTCGAKPAHTVVLRQGPTVKPGLALNLKHSPERPGTGASHHLPRHKLPLSLDLSPKVKKQSTTATTTRRALFKGSLAETFRIFITTASSAPERVSAHLHSPSVHSPLPGALVPVRLPGWSGGSRILPTSLHIQSLLPVSVTLPSGLRLLCLHLNLETPSSSPQTPTSSA